MTFLGFDAYEITTTVHYFWHDNKVVSESEPETTLTDTDTQMELGEANETIHQPDTEGYARDQYLIRNVVPF